MGILFLLLFHGLFITSAKSKIKQEWDSKSKQPLPYFRREVEEIYEDNSVESKADNARSKLIAFLIENVKEVFKDTDINLLNEFAESLEPTTIQTLLSNSSLSTSAISEDPDNNVILYDNLTINPLPFLIGLPTRTPIKKMSKYTKRDKLHVSRNLLFLGQSTILIDDNTFGLENVTQSMVHHKEYVNYDDVRALVPDTKRSCIHCDNVAVPECASPENKLIQSMLCDNDRDKCYSLHTPFGIVDRGCYSAKKNISVYVCSCNYCNSKSINEMPIMFATKQDWIQNIVDMSYSRRLKKSVLKELTCLRCEVQTSGHDDRAAADCAEGNVNAVPTELCNDKAICGIKAIKSIGYIWRGCIESPLYNYWITFCDSDLCNYDELVSVYDTD